MAGSELVIDLDAWYDRLLGKCVIVIINDDEVVSISKKQILFYFFAIVDGMGFRCQILQQNGDGTLRLRVWLHIDKEEVSRDAFCVTCIFALPVQRLLTHLLTHSN